MLSSNQSHSSDDEKTLDYTPPTQPKTNRRKRRAQPRGAVARGRVQRRRQDEIEVVTTLQLKKSGYEYVFNNETGLEPVFLYI